MIFKNQYAIIDKVWEQIFNKIINFFSVPYIELICNLRLVLSPALHQVLQMVPHGPYPGGPEGPVGPVGAMSPLVPLYPGGLGGPGWNKYVLDPTQNLFFRPNFLIFFIKYIYVICRLEGPYGEKL